MFKLSNMEGLLNQNCTVYSLNSLSITGEKTWTKVADYSCRFVKIFKQFKDSQGDQMTSVAKFQLSKTSLNVGARVDYLGNSYTVIGVEEWVDGNGDLFGSLNYVTNGPDV